MPWCHGASRVDITSSRGKALPTQDDIHGSYEEKVSARRQFISAELAPAVSIESVQFGESCDIEFARADPVCNVLACRVPRRGRGPRGRD